MHSSELGAFSYVLLRKEWDSNPRYAKSVRRISSPVHSITLASFLKGGAKVMNYFVLFHCSTYFLLYL